MGLVYKFNNEDGTFAYHCETFSSYLRFDLKYIKTMYNTFEELDKLYRKAKENRTNGIDCGGFIIQFDGRNYFKILNYSNWIRIEEEVPIIKSIIEKYYKKDAETIKDIIVKIKSLREGSSNKIKEELK